MAAAQQAMATLARCLEKFIGCKRALPLNVPIARPSPGACAWRTICDPPSVITTIQELDRVRIECRRMVTKRSLAAAGAAVVPIPGADLMVDIGLLANMLPGISRAFELDHDSVEKLDPNIAESVFVIAAGLGNNLIGRLVTRKLILGLVRKIGVRTASVSVARYVPVIGSIVAASISFGAMKLAGNAHIDDCYRTARALLVSPQDKTERSQR